MQPLTAIVATLAALASPDAPDAASATATCGDRSGAAFPSAFTAEANLVAGPLVFVSARAARSLSPEEVERFGGVKSPALLLAGRRAVVRIEPAGRGVARLQYAHDGDAPRFEELPHTIRFAACRRGRRSGSTAGGRPATFWSGFLRIRGGSACVPLAVRIDRGRWRRLTLAVARDC